jgi:hypothetical protein
LKKKRVLVFLAAVETLAIIGLAIALGYVLTKPEVPVVVGKVYQDNRYGGTFGSLDEWDYPLTQCQVVLRYAGAEGKATIAEGKESTWQIYVSDGKIIDQVQVDENGVYGLELDWQPRGIFKGDMNQEVTAVLCRVEILAPVQGFYNQKVISSSQIRVEATEDAKVILGPIFLLS